MRDVVYDSDVNVRVAEVSFVIPWRTDASSVRAAVGASPRLEVNRTIVTL